MKNKGFITMMCWILLGFSLIGCSHQEEDKEIETLAQHFLREVIILDFHQKDEDNIHQILLHISMHFHQILIPS